MKRGPNTIPGIHNYCDRWCERCYFTSRCAIYENPDDIAPGENDMSNKAFWDKLSRNFAEAMALIKKTAKKQGIDIDNIPEEDIRKYEKHITDIREELKKHPLSRISMKYIQEGKKILSENSLLEEKKEDLIRQLELGTRSPGEIKDDVAAVKDCIEVIQWYLHFIHVKFQRALHGKMGGEELAEKHGFPKDSDGSAKVALIATARSMEAWIKLRELIPASEDEVIPLLANLQQIKRLGETEFPGAEKFVRPGFDEIA